MPARRVLSIGLALLAVASPACAPKSPSVTATTARVAEEPPGPCDRASDERARAPTLLAEGKLDRTVRVLEHAQRLCPERAFETWPELVPVLVELGRSSDATKLVDAIEASPRSSPEALAVATRAHARLAETAAAPPDGHALYEASRVAAAAGKSADAQRLRDRAIVALQKIAGDELAVDVPDGFGELGSVPPVWSADGRFIALAGERTVVVLDAVTFSERLRLTTHVERLNALALSPDGKTLASADWSEDGVRLWNTTTGVSRLATIPDAPMALSFAPDGKTLACGSPDGAVRLWDLASDGVRLTLPPHGGFVSTLAFTHDGKTLASGSEDQTVRVWDVETGKLRRTLKGAAEITAVAFSPDDKTLASVAKEAKVRLWNVATGAVERVVTWTSDAQVDYASSIGFTSDGHTLAVADWQGIRLWDRATGKEGSMLVAYAARFALSPDATLLFSTSSFEARVWEVATGVVHKVLGEHRAEPRKIAITADGKTIATGAEEIQLWDGATGVPRKRLVGHTDDVDALAFSPDGQTLASGSRDRTLRLWDVSTEKIRYVRDRTTWVNALAFSPDGTRLASPSYSKVDVWDSTSATLVSTFDGHTSDVSGLAFSPDGKTLASAAHDQTLRLWSFPQGQLVRTISYAHWAGGVVYSPDGAMLASIDGTTLRLWQSATGDALATLEGHKEIVDALAFSPDGKTLASVSRDHTARLWDVDTSKERLVLRHGNMVFDLFFSPSGRALTTVVRDGRLQWWSLDGRPLVTLVSVSQHDAAYAVAPTGQIEFVGVDAAYARSFAVCRIGPMTFPFELCAERFLVAGLFARASLDDATYADP